MSSLAPRHDLLPTDGSDPRHLESGCWNGAAYDLPITITGPTTSTRASRNGTPGAPDQSAFLSPPDLSRLALTESCTPPAFGSLSSDEVESLN